MIEGQLEITIPGKTKRLGLGEAAVVPPGTSHAVRVTKDARALVVDHPRRKSIGGTELSPAPSAPLRPGRRADRVQISRLLASAAEPTLNDGFCIAAA